MAMYKTRAAFIAISAVLAVSAAGCGSGSSGQSAEPPGDGGTETLKLVLLQSYDTGVTIQRGIEAGCFAEEGLELDISETDSPPTVVSAVSSGQYDIGQFNPSVAVTVLAGGVGITSAAGGGHSREAGSMGVVTLPGNGIGTWAELEGKTVAVQGPRSAATLAMLEQVRLDGGDPKLVELVPVPQAQMQANLEKGAVDAATLLGSYLAESTTTNPDIINLGDAFSDTFGVGALVDMLYTAPATADKKADQLDRFRVGLSCAYEAMNKLGVDEWRKVVGEGLGRTEDQWRHIPWVEYEVEVTPEDLEPYETAQKEQGWISSDVDIEKFVGAEE